MSSVNALSAQDLLDENFAAAVAALESARRAAGAHPDDAGPHIAIADCHIRLANLALAIRRP